MTEKKTEGDCLAKIAAEELRAFARSHSSDRRSVLVEIGLPEPTVEFHAPSEENGYSIRPRSVVPESQAQKTASAEVIERTRESIVSIVNQPPNWLSSAHLFVVRANAAELCALAELADVVKIVPNSDLSK